jgi:hypothetical protein
MRAYRVLTFVTALVAFGAPSLSAQDRKWEIEFYGGGAWTSATEGTRNLPAAGAPIVTSSPLFPSREVPSFLFGDGAKLLNDVNTEFEVSGRIVPLDSVFARSAGRTDASFGVRLRRAVNPRVSAELAADFSPSAADAPDGFEAALEATRDSFPSAFGSLLGTGPLLPAVLSASSSQDAGRLRENTFTGGLNIRLADWQSGGTYLTVGAGFASASGTLPSADVGGGYSFKIAGEVPISESDSVTVRFERPSTYVIVFGGGFTGAMTKALAFRVDARVHAGPDTSRILIDTVSSNSGGTPAGFIESGTNPAIQFSNDPSTGRRSTLSAPALERFEVFDGGARFRTLLTAGLVVRF